MAKLSIQDLCLISLPGRHFEIQRLCKDLLAPSGMNDTDANTFEFSKQMDRTASPLQVHLTPFSIQELLANQEVRCSD